MAVVIPFASQRRSPQDRSCPFPRQTAEILFFTGVRYERMAEAQPPKAKAPGRRLARKVASRKASRRQPA